jgi:hypothetical protein
MRQRSFADDWIFVRLPCYGLLGTGFLAELRIFERDYLPAA